ncbi:MAG TPA: LacI family DNA-binding transcriptional regulator [Chthoniobacteraceae bacterium]|nr:LacI family DNA-binding transcriptional regulator [Chthoniobacteraceae bacterium]
MTTPLLKIRPTQKDIAKALGISQAAVAMALNAKTQWKLTDETVARVQAKAKEMNYSPQRQASILRSGRSHTIGVVFIYSAYHGPQERVKHLARAAIRAGYQLIAVDLAWFEDDLKQAAEYLKGAAAEGVILCNLSPEKSEQWEWGVHDWPTLCLSSPSEAAVDAVSCNMEDAFYRMTRHHLEQGSRRLTFLTASYDVAVLGGKTVFRTIADRVRGFTRAIEEQGGEVISAREDNAAQLGLPAAFRRSADGLRGQVVYPPRPPGISNAFELGAHYVATLLETGSPLPDSLVATNDDIAIGALGVCQKRNISVPQELIISGGDDSPFGRHTAVPLTTFRQPSEDLACFSIERLVQVIENRDLMQAPVHERFLCELIVRESTQRHP